MKPGTVVMILPVGPHPVGPYYHGILGVVEGSCSDRMWPVVVGFGPRRASLAFAEDELYRIGEL